MHLFVRKYIVNIKLTYCSNYCFWEKDLLELMV